MLRAALALSLCLVPSLPAFASFNLTGNPAADGWTYGGRALGNGNYVRGTGNFSYDMYWTEFSIAAGSPLTTSPTMNQNWSAGQRVVGLGGVFTPGTFTPADFGWPGITGPQTFAAPSTRINAKFGVDNFTNSFSPSTVQPGVASGAPGSGNGSHSGGDGGLGSVLVSIASGRFDPANPAGLPGDIITPTSLTGGSVTSRDLVAQYPVPPGNPGMTNGLELQVGNYFPSAAYIFTLDNNDFLATWEILLNTTMVNQFPGAYPTAVTGGGIWIATVQQGSGSTFTDGMMQTDPYAVPAPPAVLIAVFGVPLLVGLRRKRK